MPNTSRFSPAGGHAVQPPSAGAAFSLLEIADAWNHDELHPLFEPSIELESGLVRAMHAVPAWRHPTLGTVAAEDLMPSVRAAGLNDGFTWLMLHKAFGQCQEWRRAGSSLQVSVTLALDSLAAGDLAERIGELAQSQGVRPEWTVLHIQEARLGRIGPGVLENLTRLRTMGFGLGVDDFCSGHLDHRQLHSLPVTELKVQRQTMTRALRDPAAGAALAACLAAAHGRRIRTVGDGMGCREEWTLLQAAVASGPRWQHAAS